MLPALSQSRPLRVGRAVRSGRTLSVCTAEVHAERGGARTCIAVMQATMIAAAPV